MYNEELEIMDRLEEILESIKPLDQYTEIPWHAIYGMRNIISHEYANIDEAVIVSAINEDLPKLKIVIEELLRQYS